MTEQFRPELFDESGYALLNIFQGDFVYFGTII